MSTQGFEGREDIISRLQKLKGLKEIWPDLPKFKEPISVVIPTYNRAKPIRWCLESILSQQGVCVDEIIIVRDGDDPSAYTLPRLMNGTRMKMLAQPRHVGSSILRNIGVESAKNEFYMMCDDDCIFPPHALFGALHSYIDVSKDAKTIGVHLPVYKRSNFPRTAIPMAHIGMLDFGNGKITSNVDCFPEEYLVGESLEVQDQNGIFKPFELGHLNGVFLGRRQDYLDIGGFPDHMRLNPLLHYGDEIHFTMRARTKGFRAFLNPDPRFGCLHLKYGNNCGYERDGLPPKLFGYIQESDKTVENSGWRVSVEDWHYSKIMGFYLLFAKYDPESAVRWKDRCYDEFVMAGDPLFSRGLGKTIANPHTREVIWKRAIDDAEAIKSLI